jgi:hypothetical protein
MARPWTCRSRHCQLALEHQGEVAATAGRDVGEQRITEHCTQQEEFLVPWESPTIRCAWLSRGISLWCRSCRVRRSRRRRCWNRIHSPMEHCFPFEG